MKKFVIFTGLLALLQCFTPLASAATCYHYDTVIDSIVFGPYANVQNRIRELTVVRDQGIKTHPVELLIRYPGDANAFGTQPGSIEVMTNCKRPVMSS